MKKQTSPFIKIFAIMLVAGVVAAAIAAALAYGLFYANRVYGGRVVEADSGKPIEGAVVVAVWRGERATIAGPSTFVVDVKETLTDKNGEWALEGPKGRRLGRGLLDGSITAVTLVTPFYALKPPNFIIYKPGYCPYPGGYDIDACKEMYVGDKKYGNVASGDTVGLPKLTAREDRRRALPGPVRTTIDSRKTKILKKQKEFIKRIDEEAVYLGIQPYNYKFLREGADEDK